LVYGDTKAGDAAVRRAVGELGLREVLTTRCQTELAVWAPGVACKSGVELARAIAGGTALPRIECFAPSGASPPAP